MIKLYSKINCSLAPNVHKAPGPDGLNARVQKECSNEIFPILALIINESLARGDVPDE